MPGVDRADDIVAETFRHAIDSFDRFDPTLGNERAWLFGIATNLLRGHRRTEFRRLRATAREARRVPAVSGPLFPTDAAIDAERELDRVLTAIDELGETAEVLAIRARPARRNQAAGSGAFSRR